MLNLERTNEASVDCDELYQDVSRSIHEGLEDLFKLLYMQRREPVDSGVAGVRESGVWCGRHWRQRAVGNKANISAKYFDFLLSRNFKFLRQLRVNQINNHDSFQILFVGVGGGVAVINSPRVPKI